MAKYLYGASVQGIQGFIFESNKLKEITGGSEFVEQICTKFFKEVLGKDYDPKQLVQGAAGIVRYLFEDRNQCEQAVRDFPFKVQQEAPGISISQAVVETDEELKTKDISRLIQALEEQRNRSTLSFLAAPIIAERSRTNGQAAVRKEGSDYLSKQQKLKRGVAEKIMESEKSESGQTLAGKIGLQAKQLPFLDLDEISGKGDGKDQWLAVIHADGNSLGKLIIKANNTLKKEGSDVKDFYQQFSKALDTATVAAAKTATAKVFKKEIEEWNANPEKKIPIRPVLLGGDDLTVIIRAKYALDFTAHFIAAFEEETKIHVYKNVLEKYEGFEEFREGLTTCAGIAYVKPSYPFHYAENLAQQLCKAAKTESKKIDKSCAPTCAPSSLLFHQVHSSFVGRWEEIAGRELTVKTPQDVKIGSFVAGPYFRKEYEGQNTIQQLQTWVAKLLETDDKGERISLKSQLRALITEYMDNPEGAKQYEERIRNVLKSSKQEKRLEEIGFSSTAATIFTDKNGEQVSHAWDIIKLATIQNRKTEQI